MTTPTEADKALASANAAVEYWKNQWNKQTAERDTLAALVVRLKERLTDINEYWNGGNGSAPDACQHSCEISEQALALVPADLADSVVVKRSEVADAARLHEQLAALQSSLGACEHIRLREENQALREALDDESKKIRWLHIDREYAIESVETDCENADYDLGSINVVHYAVAVEIPDEFYVWWEDNADSDRPDVQQLWGPFKTNEEAQAKAAELKTLAPAAPANGGAKL